jgi:hypothetical protein
MGFVLGQYDNITAPLEQLLVDIVVTAVGLLGMSVLPAGEGETDGSGPYEIVLRVVEIGPWLGLAELEGFRCRFAVHDRTGPIAHLLGHLLLVAAPLEVEPIQQHHNRAFALSSPKFFDVEVFIFQQWRCGVFLEKAIEFDWN